MSWWASDLATLLSIKLNRNAARRPARLSLTLYSLSIETVGSPSFIESLSTRFSQFRSPLTEHGILELDEVAMVGIEGVGETPGEMSADGALFGVE